MHGKSVLVEDLSFQQYIRKIFRNNNISYPQIRTCGCVYQRVRNISFSENCAYVSFDNIDKKFMKADEPINTNGSNGYVKLLRKHPIFSNEQLRTLSYEKSKTENCTVCKTVIPPRSLCLRVDGGLSVTFCPDRQCFFAKPSW